MKYKENEIWKDIKETNNLYQISNTGKIKNKKTQKILSQINSKGGYITQMLCVDGKRITVRPHRLVAIYFIPNPNNYPIVNHKDMNKQNNNVNNLEWCTCQYNVKEAVKNKPQMLNGVKKFNREKSFAKYGYILQYDKDMNFIEKFKNSEEAFKKTGVCARNILQCINHQEGRKQAGGYIWISEKEVVENEL